MSRRHHGLTPLAVLERQHGFILKWDNDPKFRRYLRGCYADAQAWNEGDYGKGGKYVTATLNSFRYADAYRVTAEMTDLLLFAADRLDDSDKVDHTLAPTPFGFVAFEKPIPIIDARNEELLIHYLTWAPINQTDVSPITGRQRETPGVWVTMWNDGSMVPDGGLRRIADLEKVSLSALVATFGRYAFIGTEAMVDGDSVGSPIVAITDKKRAQMEAEDAAMRDLGFEVVPPTLTGHTNPARIVHALWLLLGQTITDVREDPLSRAAAKRAGQMPIPGRVTVISLRRVAGRKSEGETHVEWRHRWLVRGHWRWQPYADGRVERIWINGYAKNAHREDLPWAQSTKLYSLDR